MSPLTLEGASSFYVVEADRIAKVKAQRRLGSDSVVVPDGGLLIVTGAVGEIEARGFKDGGVLNGAAIWEGDAPIKFEQGETVVTVTPTKE